MNHRAVVLLSGGLDSATCLAIAKAEGFEPYTLSFLYGQRHHTELKAAERVARSLGAKAHQVIEIDLSRLGGSALTESSIAVPKDRSSSEMETGIPITYVPARNTIFLSYALAYAEVLGARHIFIGVSSVDYSGYPDCRPEFIRAFEVMANLATKAASEGKAITIHTPIIHLSKAQTIQRGVSLGVDYAMTHSCYDPNEQGEACGHCDSCLLRKKGFLEANIQDPTRYAGVLR